MTLIALLIWFLVALVICAAFLAVVRAVLALPAFSGLQPYGNLIYAVIVLIVVLGFVQVFYGGVPYFPPLVR